MWIHYPDRIQESVDTLLAQERRLRRSAIADRVLAHYGFRGVVLKG